MIRYVTRLAAAFVFAAPACVHAQPTSIVTWGDSITVGGNASSLDKAYPAVLGQLLSRTVVNGAVGGETSREQAARQGGQPALLTFEGNVIPPRAAPRQAITNYVSVFPITAQSSPQLMGTIEGIHGTLSPAKGPLGNPQLAFLRGGLDTKALVSAKTPFHPDTNGMESWINVFWLGRNNLDQTDQILSDTTACVHFLTSDHYVVLSVLTGANEGSNTSVHYYVTTLNAQLSQMFPGHYLDVRSALISAYDPKLPQDVADYGVNTVPASLRGDVIHLNDKGYAIVAARVAAFITQQGW